MDAPKGTVILWKNAELPTGWSLFSAADGKFIRGVPDGGTVEDTGGASTHLHTAGTIITGGAHTHSSKSFVYDAGDGEKPEIWGGTGINVSKGSHTHTASFSLASGGEHTHDLAGTDTLEADNIPPYRIAIYIIKD